MTSINKHLSIQTTTSPIESGHTSFLPKHTSNYLVKQASPLNTILANKKTLGPQEVSWTTATKAVLASTGVLGLSYLSYQYLGTKPAPSPHISMGGLVGTTIKVAGGIGFLSLIYSILGKREAGNPINNHTLNNHPLSPQKEEEDRPLEYKLIERFYAAEKAFTTNIDEFSNACEAIIGYLILKIFPDKFIETFLASIQEKIASPDEETSTNLSFCNMIETLFRTLLDNNKPLAALEIAKTCAHVKNNKRNQTYLFLSSAQITKKALNNFKIGLKLAIECAQEKNSPECQQIAKEAANIFFKKKGDLFNNFLTAIAWGAKDNLLESILDDTKLFETAKKLDFTIFDVDAKLEACTKIEEIFDIFITQKNYIMATSLLQRCVATGYSRLQRFAFVSFDTHKKEMFKAYPGAAFKLSTQFQKSLNEPSVCSDDSAQEKIQNDTSEQQQKTQLLHG